MPFNLDFLKKQMDPRIGLALSAGGMAVDPNGVGGSLGKMGWQLQQDWMNNTARDLYSQQMQKNLDPKLNAIRSMFGGQSATGVGSTAYPTFTGMETSPFKKPSALGTVAPNQSPYGPIATQPSQQPAQQPIVPSAPQTAVQSNVQGQGVQPSMSFLDPQIASALEQFRQQQEGPRQNYLGALQNVSNVAGQAPSSTSIQIANMLLENAGHQVRVDQSGMPTWTKLVDPNVQKEVEAQGQGQFENAIRAAEFGARAQDSAWERQLTGAEMQAKIEEAKMNSAGREADMMMPFIEAQQKAYLQQQQNEWELAHRPSQKPERQLIQSADGNYIWVDSAGGNVNTGIKAPSKGDETKPFTSFNEQYKPIVWADLQSVVEKYKKNLQPSQFQELTDMMNSLEGDIGTTPADKLPGYLAILGSDAVAEAANVVNFHAGGQQLGKPVVPYGQQQNQEKGNQSPIGKFQVPPTVPNGARLEFDAEGNLKR